MTMKTLRHSLRTTGAGGVGALKVLTEAEVGAGWDLCL